MMQPSGPAATVLGPTGQIDPITRKRDASFNDYSPLPREVEERLKHRPEQNGHHAVRNPTNTQMTNEQKQLLTQKKRCAAASTKALRTECGPTSMYPEVGSV